MQSISAPPTPGTHTVSVTATKAAFNSVKTNTTVLQVQTPALTVTLAPNTTTPYPSSVVWVNGTAVHGNGDSAAGSQVTLSLVGTTINAATTVSAGGTFSVSFQAPAVNGQYVLNATVASAQYLGCNGYKQVSILVTDIPTPDFVLTDDKVKASVAGGRYLEGKLVNISAAISNSGNAMAQTVNVVCYADAPSSQVGTKNITNFAVGSTVYANFTWKALPGRHNLTVVVDPTNATEEAFENNNVGTITLDIDIDTDADGIGNANDTDDDGDGYNDTVEISEKSDPLNNKSVPKDLDGDFKPDSTDPDIDNDGYLNAADAFPHNATEWADLDKDNVGDNSDPDVDGDGALNADDEYPRDPSESADTDGDKVGDNADEDDDNDGYLDEWETFLGTDPKSVLSVPSDADGDGQPDGDAANTQPWMDADDDGDDFADAEDAFPRNENEWADTDGDGTGDGSDADTDGDGYADDLDPYPGDTDNDGLANEIDLDDDGDGIRDSADQYPLDTDNDGQRNDVDTDDDGDGVPDKVEDANWNGRVDPAETASLKSDSDGDGAADGQDPYPTGQAEEPGSGVGATPGLLVTLLVMLLAPVALLVAGLVGGKPR
jgi:hypothetical protein